VLFMAAGAATRLCAPLLSDKRADPAVVSVDDAGRFAIALLGGHVGANRLAHQVATALGATPVVTTASDALDIPALDSLGADLGFEPEDRRDLAAVGAALVGGGQVTLCEDQRWPLPPLPPGVVRRKDPVPPCLVVTDRLVDPPRPAVVYRPKSLVVGVGCSRGADAEEILSLISTTLLEADLSAASIAHLASVDLKADEAGLSEAAVALGRPLRLYPVADLRSATVPTPSKVVQAAVGTPSVAEAAVLVSGADLVVGKQRSKMATVAIGRLRPRGLLHLVGLGPGAPELVPEMARRALARSEVVIGLRRYLDQAAPFLRPGTRLEPSEVGDELHRAELALREASAGRAVAVVSGGDPGVYAMASPVLERASGAVDVVCVPGVTAALAVAALLGAPLGHDHCTISLSDLLSPWQLIRARLEAAAAADLVIVIYNPRSRRRKWQLEETRCLLLQHRQPSTPVGVVADAYRPGQRVEITTLAELDVESIGMTTTLVVGNSSTKVVNGRMVTPRGYR
jgi:cobalt-precorrin 5A hydrolase/precorrin-3B C17-methyltransferase